MISRVVYVAFMYIHTILFLFLQQFLPIYYIIFKCQLFSFNHVNRTLWHVCLLLVQTFISYNYEFKQNMTIVCIYAV